MPVNFHFVPLARIINAIVMLFFLTFIGSAVVDKIHGLFIEFGPAAEAAKTFQNAKEIVESMSNILVVYEHARTWVGWVQSIFQYWGYVSPKRRIEEHAAPHPEADLMKPATSPPPAVPKNPADKGRETSTAATPTATEPIVAETHAPKPPTAQTHSADSEKPSVQKDTPTVSDLPSAAQQLQHAIKTTTYETFNWITQTYAHEPTTRSKVVNEHGESAASVFKEIREASTFGKMSEGLKFADSPYSSTHEEAHEYLFTPKLHVIGDVQFTGYRFKRCSYLDIRTGKDVNEGRPRVTTVGEAFENYGLYIQGTWLHFLKTNVKQEDFKESDNTYQGSYWGAINLSLYRFFFALFWALAFLAASAWSFVGALLVLYFICYYFLRATAWTNYAFYFLFFLLFPSQFMAICLSVLLVYELIANIAYLFSAEATTGEKEVNSWFAGGPKTMPLTRSVWRTGAIQSCVAGVAALAKVSYTTALAREPRPESPWFIMVVFRTICDIFGWEAVGKEENEQANKFATHLSEVTAASYHNYKHMEDYWKHFLLIAGSYVFSAWKRYDSFSLNGTVYNNYGICINLDQLLSTNGFEHKVPYYLYRGTRRSEVMYMSARDVAVLKLSNFTVEVTIVPKRSNLKEQQQKKVDISAGHDDKKETQAEDNKSKEETSENDKSKQQQQQNSSDQTQAPDNKVTFGKQKQQQRAASAGKNNQNTSNKNSTTKAGGGVYGRGICHTISATRLLEEAAKRLKKILLKPNNDLVLVAGDVMTFEQKVENVAALAEIPLDGTPFDAQHILIDVLAEVAAYESEDGLLHMMSHHIRVTPCGSGVSQAASIPKGRTIIGGLKYYDNNGKGHWSCVLKSKNGKNWIEYNDEKIVTLGSKLGSIATQQEEVALIWIEDTTRVGNGEEKVKCACCKVDKQQHKEQHVVRACKVCKNVLVGECTGIARAARTKKAQQQLTQQQIDEFTCAECIKSAKKEEQEKQQQAKKQKKADNTEQKKQQHEKKKQQKQEKKHLPAHPDCVQCGNAFDQHGEEKSKAIACDNCKKIAYGKCVGSSGLLNQLFGSNKFICNKCVNKTVSETTLEKKTNNNTNDKENKNTAEKTQQQSDDAKIKEYLMEYKKKNPKSPSGPPPSYTANHSKVPYQLPAAVAAAQKRMEEYSVKIPANFNEINNLGEAPKVVKTAQELADTTGDAILENSAEQDFQGRSEQAPNAAIYRGKLLHDLMINKKVPAEVQNARHPGTFENHFRCLRLARDLLIKSPKEWLQIPLTMVLVRVLNLTAAVRKWKPQTTFRTACSMQGAFNALNLYSNQKFAIELGEDPMWRYAMAIWRLKSQQNQPHGQTVVTADSIAEAVLATEPTDLRTKAALILQWFLAARAGDVLKLRKEDVKIENANIMATFRHAKTVAKRGSYTVKSAINDNLLLNTLKEYLELIPNEKDAMIFPPTGLLGLSIPRQEERMRQALKFKDPALTTRSIRRGALQAMSLQGVDADTLMQFSGHKSKDTLLRYLDHGRLFAKEKENAQQAAQHLAK